MTPTTRQLAGLAMFAAIATILAAWAFEIFGGYQPCALCLRQRVPYYVVIPVLAVAIVGIRHRARLATILVAFCALVMVVGAGLGVQHSGVEWEWWAPPAACVGVSSGGTTLVGDLLSQLETVRIVRCDEVQWRLAGLTFANYNSIIAAGIALLLILAVKRA